MPLESIKENPNLLILSSDVSTSAGLDRFRKQYPEITMKLNS